MCVCGGGAIWPLAMAMGDFMAALGGLYCQELENLMARDWGLNDQGEIVVAVAVVLLINIYSVSYLKLELPEAIRGSFLVPAEGPAEPVGPQGGRARDRRYHCRHGSLQFSRGSVKREGATNLEKIILLNLEHFSKILFL